MKNANFPEKKSEIFRFLTKCRVAPRGEGVCGNLKVAQKVAITPRGVFDPRVKNLTQVSRGFEKYFY